MSSDRFVEIDRLGRLILPDQELEGWFAKRSGRWRVVPGPRTLMIFERVEDKTTTPDDEMRKALREQVVMCGIVTSRGQITDAINMLHAGRWEGSFHVLATNVRKTLMFKAGDVVGAVSTAKSDRLGELICAHGIITRDQLEEAVQEAGGPQRLGAVLITKKLLTPHQLYAFLNLQVKEIFYSLLFLDEGQYYFKRRMLDDPAWRQLRFNTSSLMLDGMRRVDEMQFFRERIPSSKVIFEKGELQELVLEDVDLTLLNHINGQKDLRQVAQLAHLNEYDATKVAYRLLQAGIIRPRSENFLGRRGQEAHDQGLAAVLNLTNTVLRQLLREAVNTGREAELRRAPTAFFSAETTFKHLFQGIELTPDGSLDVRQLLSNLGTSGARVPTEFLYQGMNEFLSFAVFVVVDGLDPEQEQQIRRRIDELLEA